MKAFLWAGLLARAAAVAPAVWWLELAGEHPSRACAGGLCRKVAHFVFVARASDAPDAWAEDVAAGGEVSLDGGATWLVGFGA